MSAAAGSPSRHRVLLRLVLTTLPRGRLVGWQLANLALAVTDGALLLGPVLLLRNIVDNSIVPRTTRHLAAPLVAFALLTIARAATQAFALYWRRRIGESLNRRLRDRLIAVVRSVPYDSRLHLSTGGLVSRIVNDCTRISMGVTSTFGTFLDSVVLVAGGLAVLFYLDWQLTMVSLAILAVGLLPARSSSRRLSTLTADYVDTMTSLSGSLTEHLGSQGLQLASICGAGQDLAVELSAATRRMETVEVSRWRVQAGLSSVLGTLDAAGSLAVLAVGALMAASGQITIGVLAVFALDLTLLYSPAMRIFELPGELQGSLSAADRVWQLASCATRPGATASTSTAPGSGADTGRTAPGSTEFTAPTETGAPASGGGVAAGPARATSGGAKSAKSRKDAPGTLRLSGVSYAYNGSALADSLGLGSGSNRSESADESFTEALSPAFEVLKDVDLVIEDGEHVAVIGPSGSGKSTMLQLMAGLLSPMRGQVCIGGQDVHSIGQGQRAQHVYLVTQDAFFFRRSIRENLCLGLADVTDEMLEAACEMANATAIVQQLPKGFDTTVGEEGRSLSGGERQRLSLARAMLHSPQVLLLDEPTAHLDSQAEAEVRAGLERAAEGRTVVVVSHREPAVSDVGRVIVLRGGRITEDHPQKRGPGHGIGRGDWTSGHRP
ncbi:MAG: ABC transporter ATP-binding protein [Actinomycetota bacterium]|nr:ABC transporter ATP-binding protein [Actinomycetota bacterium]